MVVDSNIIIYSIQPEHGFLRELIAEEQPVVSAISLVEVLGYHGLSEDEKLLLERFFAITPVLSVSQPVIDRAVELRQARRMSLGDSLVAATCLVHDEVLLTRNSRDFAWIEGLSVANPFETVGGV